MLLNLIFFSGRFVIQSVLSLVISYDITTLLIFIMLTKIPLLAAIISCVIQNRVDGVIDKCVVMNDPKVGLNVYTWL